MTTTRREFLVVSALGSAAVGANPSAANDRAERDVPIAAAPCPLKIETRPTAILLSPQVKSQLARLQMRQAMWEAGCLMTYEDHGPQGEKELFPRLPFPRSMVSRGSRLHGNYQHHSQLAKFKGRYYLAWSNGFGDEEAPGQQILIASSVDGLQWTPPAPVLPRQAKENLVHNCVGLLGTADELLLYSWSEVAERAAAVPGMHRIEPATSRVDLYASRDGKQWALRTPRLVLPGKSHAAMFEAPRPASDGTFLCGGAQSGPVVFRWKADRLAEPPEVVRVPPAPDASFPYGEATWYQARDGLLVMFWRDESQSCRLFVNFSIDHGRTWSAPIISDIPNSMQRVYAGAISDGRVYLLNDANPRLLDRRQLTIALSNDGRSFDRIWMLIDDPTRQRHPGLLKAHGWQYPCALADGDRLLVAYSVNKEDIECGVLDLAAVPAAARR